MTTKKKTAKKVTAKATKKVTTTELGEKTVVNKDGTTTTTIDMSVQGLEGLTEEQIKIAKNLGYNGMFHTPSDVNEPYHYVEKATKDPRAIVGVAMLQNFMALYVAKNFVPKKG